MKLENEIPPQKEEEGLQLCFFNKAFQFQASQ